LGIISQKLFKNLLKKHYREIAKIISKNFKKSKLFLQLNTKTEYVIIGAGKEI